MMTSDEQLAEWVRGNPIHRGEKGSPDSECCADFSCCQPSLLAPEHERQAFARADDATRHQILMGFLGRMIDALPDKPRVHIAGDAETAEV
jgi:hypothetical protein